MRNVGTFIAPLDIARKKDLVGLGSCVFVFGRNANASNLYLRGPDGVPSNIAGCVIDRALRIVGIGAATNGIETWTAEVRKNNAVTVIASLSIAAAATAYRNDLSVDVDAGDEIQVYCNGANIGNPVVTVFLEER